jgi:hypothetical protein
MWELLNLSKRNVKLIITIDAEYCITAAVKKATKDVMSAVPPAIQQFHNVGFSQIESRIGKPRYILTHLVGKSKNEIAEAVVCLPLRENNSVSTVFSIRLP